MSFFQITGQKSITFPKKRHMQVQVTVDFRYTNRVDLRWIVSIYKKNMLVNRTLLHTKEVHILQTGLVY